MPNIITVEQVEKALGIRFKSKVRKQLIEQTPQSVPEGWIAVPVFPISLFDLREITRESGKRVFWSDTGGWYEDEDWFTEEPNEVRWIVVQSEARKETADKTYDDQVKLLRPGEQMASAYEGIYAMALNFLVTGERLFSDYYVRTSTPSDGYLVSFGNFDAEGADVDGWEPGEAGSGLLSLFARSLESLTAEPSAFEPPQAVQACVTMYGVEYKGELRRAL